LAVNGTTRTTARLTVVIAIASSVRNWQANGVSVVVARFVGLHGFGGRRADEALAIAATGERAGSLLGGAAETAIAEAAADVTPGNAVLLTVNVADNDAVGCGLACGGRAEILVQDSTDVPVTAWASMANGEPVVIATIADGPSRGRSLAVHPDGTLVGDLGDPSITVEAVNAAHAMLTRPKDFSKTVMTEAGPVVVSLMRPGTKVLCVGEAALADALAAQGDLLGWSTTIVSDQIAHQELIDAAASLGPGDALVVLSHDLAASCGALDAALKGRCGYLGALGSRHTQQARATTLKETHGHSDESVARIHGPVGLDLGSRTPAETALAIAAEIVAALAGRSAASLKGSTGPLNG
jgi:xanthine dehydrogenase accessory factor